jgi:hypothetical protein
MTKQTKMLLGVGALAAVGYLVWKSQSNTKTNFTTSKRAGTRLVNCSDENCSGAAGNLCGESCLNGTCNVAVYGSNGKITHYVTGQACPKVV